MIPVIVSSLKLAHFSKASNWIGVQTSVHRFDSRTPHKPVVSKTFEADIWVNSYDHLTDVGGQTTLAVKGCVRSTQHESGLIQVNDDQERKGGQAGRDCG